MAIYINGNKKIKKIFANVNGEKKSISSAWVNQDVVPTKVFQLNNSVKDDDPYEVAPENEYSDWNYSLNEDNNVIILNQYLSTTSTDVVVYANYIIDGNIYKTQLASYGENGITDKNYMFCNKKNIKTIKFSNKINTRNITNMSHMFDTCQALTSLDLSMFDTKNVTDMSYMFNWTPNITHIEGLDKFDTSNVTNMGGMFSTTGMEELDLSSWNTSNVTNMQDMFCFAYFKNLNLSGWNTSNVTNMRSVFYSLRKLESLNVNGWHTNNVIDAYRMFSFCTSLTALNLVNFNTNKMSNMIEMFLSCTKLTKIYVGTDWNTSLATSKTFPISVSGVIKSVDGAYHMFEECGTSSVTYK